MMKNVFVGYSKKEIRLFLILLILVLALPVTVFLVKKVQDLRSRAAAGPAQLLLRGPKNVQPGDSFTVKLFLKPGVPLENVSAFEAYLSYPRDKLEVESCTINSKIFPTEIKKLCQGGKIDLAGGVAVLSTPSATPTAPPRATNTPTPTSPPGATNTPIPPTATATVSPTTIAGKVTVRPNGRTYHRVVVYLWNWEATKADGVDLFLGTSNERKSWPYQFSNLSNGELYIIQPVVLIGEEPYYIDARSACPETWGKIQIPQLAGKSCPVPIPYNGVLNFTINFPPLKPSNEE